MSGKLTGRPANAGSAVGGTYRLSCVNYIRATDKQKVVSLNVISGASVVPVQFFLNDEPDDDEMDSRTLSCNKTSLQFADGGGYPVLHNIYESSRPFYKSPMYRVGVSERTGTTYDFKNVFQHSDNNGIDSVVQVQNTLYGMSPESVYGHSVLECDSYSYLSLDNGEIAMPNAKVETYLYDKDVVSALITGKVTREQLSGNEEIKDTIYGIWYSSVCEAPGTVQNDYDSSNVAVTVFKTKNQYDSQYTMEHKYALVDNCRTYVGLDSCNTQVYLKYFDNVRYQGVRNEAGVIQAEKSVMDRGKYRMTLPNVEVIEEISRYASLNVHPTPLYSVRLNTDILKGVEPELAAKLKAEIASSVKKITASLAPAQTQLFGVEINDI